MRNHSQELYETSDSQTYHFPIQPQALSYPIDVFLNSFNINFIETPTNETSPSQYYNLKINQEFTRTLRKNIVLPLKNQEKAPVSKIGFNQRFKDSKIDGKKNKPKPNQKESRNVYSNVLRIFFKSILQLGTYDALIHRIFERQNLAGRKEDFYGWLLAFNINFKNYIRSSQLKRILSTAGHTDYKKTLLVVLKHYLNSHAVSHCLTSKRIDLSSLKMHLSGLKELYQEAINMKSHIV